MKVVVRQTALKEIKKISEPYKSQIKSKIIELADFPEISNIKKLKNHQPPYRLRVGQYRVLFDVIEDRIEIASIRHRKDAY